MEYSSGTTWHIAIHGMPAEVSIRCPRCGHEAILVPPFRRGVLQSAKHALKVPLPARLERYPTVFPWKDPDNMQLYGKRLTTEATPIWGVATCRYCAYLAKHRLRWPDDAYFQVTVIGQVLWAWDRDYLIRLREYVAATSRRLPGHWMHRVFIQYVPSIFFTSKHRTRVLRAIDRALSRSAPPNNALQRTRFARR